MKLSPLVENEAVRKLLMVVPRVFHEETVKTLRMIQFSSWLAGFDEGQASAMEGRFPPAPKKNGPIPILTDREP